MQRAGFYVISFRLRSFKDIGSGCLATEADRIDGVAKLVWETADSYLRLRCGSTSTTNISIDF